MKMPSVPAVVFDLGKVLVDFDYSIAANRLAPHCTCPVHEIKPLIHQDHLLYRYEEGLMSTREFFEAVKEETGFKGTFEQFCEAFSDIFTPIPEMVGLHAEIRALGLTTCIFSNTNELAVQQIRRNFPFFGHFDGYVLSYEHRALKPYPPIYQQVEKLTARKGKEIIYIDDRPENILTGQEMGWSCVLHASPAQTRALLFQTGLLPFIPMGFKRV